MISCLSITRYRVEIENSSKMAVELKARLIARFAGGSLTPTSNSSSTASTTSSTSTPTVISFQSSPTITTSSIILTGTSTPLLNPVPQAQSPQSESSSSDTALLTGSTPYNSIPTYSSIPAYNSIPTSPTTTSSLISTSSSPSSATQRIYTLDSKVTSVTSPTKASTLPTTVFPKTSHQVADGAVAGAVVGVAIGVALITFLVTFFIMRRKRNATGRGHSVVGSASEGPGYQADEKPKRAPVTRSNRDASEYEKYLPPSADDKAIEQRTKNTLDQIELHVENYYHNTSNTSTRPNDRELAPFNSPYLPKSLASMLSHSRDGTPLIKHVLAYLVISSISPSAKPGSSLLPAEFVGLSSSAASTEFSPKPGKTHILH